MHRAMRLGTAGRVLLVATAGRVLLVAGRLREPQGEQDAKGEHCHLRIPSLLMRARAQATVRVWKMRSIDIPRPILRGAVLNGLAWVPMCPQKNRLLHL